MKFNDSIVILLFIIGIFTIGSIFFFFPYLASLLIYYLVMFVTTGLIIQSLFTIYTMIYTWNSPDSYTAHRAPRVFDTPTYSFTALVAARHESRVIEQTIYALHSIDYPDNLKEVIIIMRADDVATITAATKAIHATNASNIRVLVSTEDLRNKPMSLNRGLQDATGDIIVVFDAEDEPNKGLYNAVNTLFLQSNVDVVQSGVQLMDYRSSWYATLNVLEYFFWFKSALHFFASVGAIPLGGNTVFFKKTILRSIGGWDEAMLTEDADIGMRLSSQGANISVVYDEQLVTREETPPTVKGLIKQRIRWHQGFLQIFFQWQWMRLSTIRQRLLMGYVLSTPLFQALWLLYVPCSIIILTSSKLPIVVVLYSFIPLYLLMFQYVLYTVGLFIFTRSFHVSYPLWMPAKILITLFPFQFVLGWSSIMAFRRLFKKNYAWEKTEHRNAHRNIALVNS